jgi:hypothetical protein
MQQPINTKLQNPDPLSNAWEKHFFRLFSVVGDVSWLTPTGVNPLLFFKKKKKKKLKTVFKPNTSSFFISLSLSLSLSPNAGSPSASHDHHHGALRRPLHRRRPPTTARHQIQQPPPPISHPPFSLKFSHAPLSRRRPPNDITTGHFRPPHPPNATHVTPPAIPAQFKKVYIHI